MQATVHFLVGAAIATIVRDPAGVVPMAFLSHYILDFLPHIDPETFVISNRPYTFRERVSLAADVIIVLALTASFFFWHRQGGILLLGGVAAQAPDWLVPLERYRFFTPLRLLHERLHWPSRWANRWSWFVAGIAVPVVISLGALAAVALA